jgi:dihydrofolate reductase
MPNNNAKAVRFALVVAHDEKLGIGKKNQLPWHIKPDLKHFRELTTAVEDLSCQNAVVMGRKTWDSLPEERRPLQGRFNFVLTRNETFRLSLQGEKDQQIVFVSNLADAIATSNKLPCENCFVIGGAEVYRAALVLPEFKRLYVTEIKGNFNCDVFFPDYHQIFCQTECSQWFSDGSQTFRFCQFQRIAAS